MKKIISIILVAIMMLPCLVSCDETSSLPNTVVIDVKD